MKKLLTILCTTLLLATTACQHEDIWDRLNDHEQRIEQLERQCRELNSNVLAIQTILTGIEQGDYVTEVMKIMENGTEVGYSITFAKSGTITIYHGTNGTDGANGTDGTTPKIGVKKASDGAYYWTTGDDWLTDDQGNKIAATVSDPNAGYITPQFRIADGVWYISYDNGNSWRAVEVPENEEEKFFNSVTYDDTYVYFVLADGTEITVPKYTGNKYATAFTAEEDALVAKVRDNIDAKTVVFLLISDTHASDDASYEQAAIARKLAEKVGADAIVHLGDMIDENPKSGKDGSLDRLMRYMDGTSSSNIPFLHAIGHHEKYGSVIYPSNEADFKYYLTNDQVAGLTVRRYDRHLNAVRDPRNIFNYYVDFDYQQLRCIFVDSVHMRWGFDENTISWTRETINSAPEGYKLIFFSHVPCLAKANFRNTLVNEEPMLDMLNECTDAGRTILGWSHGHLHGDNVVHSNETTFPIVATTCNINRGTSKDSTSPKYDSNLVYYKTRTTGTIDQYAMDILCIHPDEGKLHYFRFGVGKDRIVSSSNTGEYPSLGESVYVETSIGGITGATGIDNGATIRSRSTYRFDNSEVNLIYSETGEWYLYAYSGDTYIGILQTDGTFAFTSSTSDDRTIGAGEVIDLRNYDSSYSFRVCGYPDAHSPNTKVTTSTKDMWNFYLI